MQTSFALPRTLIAVEHLYPKTTLKFCKKFSEVLPFLFFCMYSNNVCNNSSPQINTVFINYNLATVHGDDTVIRIANICT